MNTLEVPEKDIRVEVPDHWDEMKPHQLHYVLQQAFLFTSGGISYHDFMTRCFFKLADLCRTWKTIVWEFMKPKHMVEEKNANIFLLSEHFCSNLLKKNDSGQLEINYNTVVNHFPGITVAGRIWLGPADLLSDLTFGEFRTAIEEMNEYFREKDPRSLLRMIACLYRPAIADPATDRKPVRISLERPELDRLADHLQQLPEWQRLAILLWFTWCIHYIQTETLIIEGKEISLKVLFPKREKGDGDGASSPGLGWTGILYAIAKEGLFGDIEKTDKAGLFDILLYMYNNHIEAKRNRK